MLYSYAPNFAGQPSIKTDSDGEMLYLHAVMPDDPVSTGDVKLFKTSNAEAEAVTALTYQVVEKSPFRLIIKGTSHKLDAAYDLSVLATACADYYLMSLSGGDADANFMSLSVGDVDANNSASGKYFKWDKRRRSGVWTAPQASTHC